MVKYTLLLQSYLSISPSYGDIQATAKKKMFNN
jgi:hypothetical protein